MTKVLLPLLWVSGLGCYNVSYHLKFLWFFSCQLNFSLFNFSLVSLNFADLGYVHQFWPILRYLSRSSKFTFSSRNFVNFLIRHFPSWNIRGDVLNTSIWKQTVDDTPVKVVIVWRTDTYYKCPASPCNNTQISWFVTGSKCSIMFSHKSTSYHKYHSVIGYRCENTSTSVCYCFFEIYQTFMSVSITSLNAGENFF